MRIKSRLRLTNEPPHPYHESVYPAATRPLQLTCSDTMLPQSSSVTSAHVLGGDSACAHPSAVRAQLPTAHGSARCACRPATPSSAVGHRAHVRGTRALHVPVAFLELRALNPELRHEVLGYVLDTTVDERRAWRAATLGDAIRRAAARCTIAGRSASAG